MYVVYLVRIFKQSLTKVVENRKVGLSLSSAKRAMIQRMCCAISWDLLSPSHVIECDRTIFTQRLINLCVYFDVLMAIQNTACFQSVNDYRIPISYLMFGACICYV